MGSVLNFVSEIHYTSAPRLLGSDRSDLGVIAATEGTPDEILKGISLHRSYPMSQVKTDSRAGQLPARYIFRKINGFFYAVKVSYAGADHTGRDTPYSHEFVIPEQLLNSADICPADVYQQLFSKHAGPGGSLEPRWLKPESLTPVQKMQSADARADLLSLMPPDVAACMLSIFTENRDGRFGVVIIPESVWDTVVPRLGVSLMRCLPPHLQHGILAQTDSLQELPSDIRLLMLPEEGALGSELLQNASAISAPVMKWDSSGVVPVGGDLAPGSGYGHQFIMEEQLVVRKYWTYFNLDGQDGERDCQLLLNFLSTLQSALPERIAACRRGRSQSIDNGISNYFDTEYEKIVSDETLSLGDLVILIKDLRANEQHPDSQIQAILGSSHYEAMCLAAPSLDMAILKELVAWIDQMRSNGEIANQLALDSAVPDRIIREHFDELPIEVRPGLIQILVDFTTAGWRELGWVSKYVLDHPELRTRTAGLIKAKRPVTSSELEDYPEIKNMVRSSIQDRSLMEFVNERNYFDYNHYLSDNFEIYRDAQKPAWWVELERSTRVVSMQATAPNTSYDSIPEQLMRNWKILLPVVLAGAAIIVLAVIFFLSPGTAQDVGENSGANPVVNKSQNNMGMSDPVEKSDPEQQSSGGE